MNLLGIESSSRKLSVGLMKEDSFSELHSEKINDTANSLPILSKKITISSKKYKKQLNDCKSSLTTKKYIIF